MVADIYNVTSLSDDASIFLFELFFWNDPNNPFRFCAYENVRYGGFIYNPLACNISGLSYQNSGIEATPQLSVVDENKIIGNFIRSQGGIETSEITVRRIKKRALDIGTSPNYNYRHPADRYVISAKVSERQGELVFALRNRATFSTSQIPGRIINSTCSWKKYRGEGCNYIGNSMFTAGNIPTADPTLDVCALTLEACIIRNNVDNFSGCPNIDEV